MPLLLAGAFFLITYHFEQREKVNKRISASCWLQPSGLVTETNKYLPSTISCAICNFRDI